MKKLVLLLALATVFSLSAIAQTTEIAEEVIVRIDDEIITLNDFNKKFDPVRIALSQQYSGAELESQTNTMKKSLFNIIVNQRLLKYRAQSLGYTMPESFYQEMLNYFKNQSQAKTDEEFLKALEDNGMTVEAIREMAESNYYERALFQQEVFRDKISSESRYQEYYEEHSDRYRTKASFRLSQLIIPYTIDNKEAKRVEIDEAFAAINGGEDFGEVYRRYTPNSAPDATGDIGKVGEESMRAEMLEAIKDLSAGEVSSVVELPAVFLIIKVTEKAPARLIPLEEIKDQVLNDMRMEAVNKGLNELVAKYKKEIFIEIKSNEFLPLYDPTFTKRSR